MSTTLADPILRDLARHEAEQDAEAAREELVEARISVLAEQMQVYRERVDEINVQLMTLSKVGQAAKLRQNLQGKMQTISEKLQATTMETTELEGNLMTLRIALQDKLAELSFEEPKAKTLAAK